MTTQSPLQQKTNFETIAHSRQMANAADAGAGESRARWRTGRCGCATLYGRRFLAEWVLGLGLGGHKSVVAIYISILWSNNNCSNNFLRWFTNYQPSDDHCSLLLRISAIIPSMVKFDQDLGAQTCFLFSSKVASSSWPALLLDSWSASPFLGSEVWRLGLNLPPASLEVPQSTFPSW